MCCSGSLQHPIDAEDPQVQLLVGYAKPQPVRAAPEPRKGVEEARPALEAPRPAAKASAHGDGEQFCMRVHSEGEVLELKVPSGTVSRRTDISKL